MKLIPAALLLLMVVQFVACDPGMKIRQSATNPSLTVENRAIVSLRIAESHPLIGERWYSPAVEVTNLSDWPLSVVNVELATPHATYQNKPQRETSYPFVLGPGQTQTLEIRFELKESVYKALFKQAAEFRVYLRQNDREETVSSMIVGEALSSR